LRRPPGPAGFVGLPERQPARVPRFRLVAAFFALDADFVAVATGFLDEEAFLMVRVALAAVLAPAVVVFAAAFAVVVLVALADATLAGFNVRSDTVAPAAALRIASIAFSAIAFRLYVGPVARVRPWLVTTQVNSPAFGDRISNFAAMLSPFAAL
jgi:hypothetical protein